MKMNCKENTEVLVKGIHLRFCNNLYLAIFVCFTVSNNTSRTLSDCYKVLK